MIMIWRSPSAFGAIAAPRAVKGSGGLTIRKASPVDFVGEPREIPQEEPEVGPMELIRPPLVPRTRWIKHLLKDMKKTALIGKSSGRGKSPNVNMIKCWNIANTMG